MTALLEFDTVSKRFSRRLDAVERLARRLGANVSEQTVHAVDRVSFEVEEREVVGLVGESGCGKSTLGRIACGLYQPTDGTVRYRGEPVSHANGAWRFCRLRPGLEYTVRSNVGGLGSAEDQVLVEAGNLRVHVDLALE